MDETTARVANRRGGNPVTHTIKVLSPNGDDTVAEWDPKVKDQVELAEVQFDRLAGSMLAFTDTPVAEQIRKFDPEVDIIMTPQLVGG